MFFFPKMMLDHLWWIFEVVEIMFLALDGICIVHSLLLVVVSNFGVRTLGCKQEIQKILNSASEINIAKWR